VYFVFDVMMLSGRDVTGEPHDARQQLLSRRVLPALAEPIRPVGELDASLRDLMASVKAQGLEGLVAKRRDSRYEAGVRSGAWLKMRVNRAEDFVIGGYTVGTTTFDALILGERRDGGLFYVARTRNGFTAPVRRRIFDTLQPLRIAACPFVNLPEARSGRWGQGLTKAKMVDCRWVEPVLTARIEFLEWTGEHHLRHTRFVALRT
jgi:bifunctional non-homologous end joining protein LigD